MTTAVSSSYQDCTDHRVFFLSGPCELHAVHLIFKNSFTKEEEIISKMHFYSFQLSCVSYMTTHRVRHELYFTVLFLVIYSLMTMWCWIYLLAFEICFRNRGCVHLSHPIKYHVILELNLQHERISLDSDVEKLSQWHLLSDLISIHKKGQSLHS